MGTLGMIHKSGATFSNDFRKFVLAWHEEGRRNLSNFGGSFIKEPLFMGFSLEKDNYVLFFSKFRRTHWPMGYNAPVPSSVVSNCPPQAQAGNWQLYIHTTSIYYQRSQWVEIFFELHQNLI
jgi:hypothetical protein